MFYIFHHKKISPKPKNLEQASRPQFISSISSHPTYPKAKSPSSTGTWRQGKPAPHRAPMGGTTTLLQHPGRRAGHGPCGLPSSTAQGCPSSGPLAASWVSTDSGGSGEGGWTRCLLEDTTSPLSAPVAFPNGCHVSKIVVRCIQSHFLQFQTDLFSQTGTWASGDPQARGPHLS